MERRTWNPASGLDVAFLTAHGKRMRIPLSRLASAESEASWTASPFPK